MLQLRPAAHQSFVRATAIAGGSNTGASRGAPTPIQECSGLVVWRGGATRPAGTGEWVDDAQVVESLEVRLHEVHDALTASDGASVARIGLLRRRRGMTREEFGDHYLCHHVPLVMDQGPLFQQYSVSLVDSPRDGGWDAVVWQTFADLATWAEHDRQVMEEKPAVREDLARFVGELVSFEGRSPTDGAPGTPTARQGQE
jgi:hypothetical protein